MQYYKVFYTDKPLPANVEPDFAFIMPLNAASRDEALKDAFKLIYRGAVVWKIDGPAGYHIERAEIEKQYRVFKTG